jgi:asparagine synthase (glutamine-hydrolysing)
MCGILGIYQINNKPISKDLFLDSLEYLSNRGPDETGYQEFNINGCNLKFGHKRLSILDLSKNGNQPMSSSNYKYSIVFNGEIYNHLNLRKNIENIENISWKSNSDTETLIEYISVFGLDKTLNDIRGMFAFCLFDIHKNELYFARDISGEKPLYLMFDDNFFNFSSTLKPLMFLAQKKIKLNKISISKFLNFNYIPSPLSIFQSCFKLPPATYIKINLNLFKSKIFNDFNDLVNSKGVDCFNYWKITNQNQSIKKNDDKSIIDNTESLLEKSVNNQLISDVPLGVFLSGGVDSSLILSLINKNYNKINTFTMGFDFDEYDESKYALKIANYFKTNHMQYNCSKKDFLDTISEVPLAYDEPFADSSQIPTMLISKLTKKDVKVVLGGDGGDELFGGYNRYLIANKYWYLVEFLPIFLRNKILKLIKKLNFNDFSLFIKFLTFVFNDKSTLKNKSIKIYSKLSLIENKLSFYKSFVTEWGNDSKVIDFFDNSSNKFENFYNNDRGSRIENLMMKSDFVSYLPDDILTKVDRASMHYGLEARNPFLDKDVIEYAFNMEIDKKIHKGETKFILKKILEKYLPREYFIRPKHGFGVPIKNWLKNELNDWTLDNISKSSCDMHGFFNYDIVKKTYKEHLVNGINNEHKLWSIIQFNQWYKHYHKYISN